ncbi:hypothetical protein RND71_030224 [Anisodus tanguticus]|uniref:Uncharacterized protein n=1 Tax=Anisodus tanguticus TaxID=243964 RepID=A0AAE1RFM7_9SOLA|nr:hypothetical protein RND71_030224 [Anisodus tanguticus]
MHEEEAESAQDSVAAEEAVDAAVQREEVVGRKVLLKRLRLRDEAEAVMQNLGVFGWICLARFQFAKGAAATSIPRSGNRCCFCMIKELIIIHSVAKTLEYLRFFYI